MNCCTCGKDVIKHPQRKGKNVFCSQQCFSLNKEKGKIEYRKCSSCGIEFRAFVKKNAKFCSRLCFSSVQAKDKVQKNCDFCGVLFQTSKYLLSKNRGKFCSNSCTRRSVRQPDEIRYAINKFGCWIWKGWVDNKGYGRTTMGEKSISAHQYLYEKLVGRAPEGLEMDHVCRNTACCNPAHMKLVTHHENVLRGARSKMNLEKIQAIKDMLSLDGFKNKFAEAARAFGASISFVKNLQ